MDGVREIDVSSKRVETKVFKFHDVNRMTLEEIVKCLNKCRVTCAN